MSRAKDKLRNRFSKSKGRGFIDRFYKSYEWCRLRVEVLKKYGRECMLCGATKGQMNVDHIMPRKHYPELELEFSNMQVLCSQCNKGKGNTTFDVRPAGSITLPQVGTRPYPALNSCSHTVSDYTCRIYKCGKQSKDKTGYCEEHCSELRTGLRPGTKGSTPVVIRRPARAV